MTDQPETSLFDGPALAGEEEPTVGLSAASLAAATAAGGPSDLPSAPGVDGASAVAGLAFDKALAELQTVVQRLETGGLPLEESIALYERGVALHEHCARLLTDAELRVQRLVEQAGGALRTLDFDPDDAAEG